MIVTVIPSCRLAGMSRWIRSPWARIFAFSVGFAMSAALFAPPAEARGLRVVFANDFLTTNRFDDELYTGALMLELDKGGYHFTFGENMFTDSENNVRFDETFLSVERALPPAGEWQTALEVGLIRVGEGLLGQSAQNAFHDLIGNEDVDLPYVDGNRVHATVRLRVYRPLPVLRDLSLTAHGEVFSAVEFKQHVAAGLWVRLPRVSFATFSAGVGGRYSSTEFEALESRIERFAPTFEAEVRFRNNMSISWTYNEFGTKAEHFTIAYDVAAKKQRLASERADARWRRGR